MNGIAETGGSVRDYGQRGSVEGAVGCIIYTPIDAAEARHRARRAAPPRAPVTDMSSIDPSASLAGSAV
jgi:hypothetical protein